MLLRACAAAATLFFYIVPITIVSGMLSLEKITKAIPALKPTVDDLSPSSRAAITAFLPTVTLLVFMAILPTLCLKLASMQGFPSHSLIDADGYGKLFNFYLP